MKACILLAIILCCLGCNKDEPNLVSTDDSPVHLTGVVATSTGNWVASYWKNGVYSNLTNDSTIFSGVNSLYVDESSVLIGGFLVNSFTRGVIWQNGNQSIIKGAYGSTTLVASHNNNLVGVWKDDSLGWVLYKNDFSQPILDTASFFPTAIAASGDDLFIAGNAKGYVGNHFDYTNMYAQYWKNGQLIFRESARSYATSIFIHQNDVYMAGYLDDSHLRVNIACYWKNGQRVNLAAANDSGSRATSIFVTETNIYVSGDLSSRAVYWKDGDPIYVSDLSAIAKAVFVKGTDVYLAGSYEGRPAYWKNKVKQNISNSNKQGWIDFIVVGSN